MRRLLLFIPIIFICACGGKQPRLADQTAWAGQIITISDTTLDSGGTDTVRFGRMHSGEIAVKELLLRNTSARTIVIVTYRRNCGCTTFEHENQPIVSGGEQKTSITFDSRGEYGWQLKVLELSFSDSKTPLKLYVEAEVE